MSRDFRYSEQKKKQHLDIHSPYCKGRANEGSRVLDVSCAFFFSNVLGGCVIWWLSDTPWSDKALLLFRNVFCFKIYACDQLGGKWCSPKCNSDTSMQIEKEEHFDRIWVLQAELGLFSNGEPSFEHAIGAPGDSCAMTSKESDLELMEKSQSNAKLIKRHIFVYLLTGKKKKNKPLTQIPQKQGSARWACAFKRLIPNHLTVKGFIICKAVREIVVSNYVHTMEFAVNCPSFCSLKEWGREGGDFRAANPWLIPAAGVHSPDCAGQCWLCGAEQEFHPSCALAAPLWPGQNQSCGSDLAKPSLDSSQEFHCQVF